MKKNVNLLWAALTVFFSSMIFMVWYTDYTSRDYSESIGFPLVFYEFQGGINGAVTDSFSTYNLAIDVLVTLVAIAILVRIVLKLLKR